MGNDKIAAALGLTVNSAKVMVNELIREGYLFKAKDNHSRRVLNLSGKPYLTISCVDLSNIDKKIIAQEAANYQRDAEYYKQQYELEKAIPTHSFPEQYSRQNSLSTHFDSFVIKGIRRYKDVIADPRGVYAFISAAGDFYYVTEKRCPFAADDVVYVTDCHN